MHGYSQFRHTGLSGLLIDERGGGDERAGRHVYGYGCGLLSDERGGGDECAGSFGSGLLIDERGGGDECANGGRGLARA
jgi:hypothetical protein